ncbi:hypothetical protein GHT06_020309 [Daphnia sinensis]|uniref:Endonuclease/exonuclease/phosphatase domain-containing protein n=1 Tax=Daphnia sinensis TaxID=1820382 RepID=A0AAD5PTV9_9CRUS|nr:hypothetical protein GHT06_020309 [Daphnia sinensis]
MNIPPGYIAFHALNHEHAYGAAILVKLALAESCRAADPSCRNQVAAVDLFTAHGTFRLISVYLKPSCPDFSALFCCDLSMLLSASSIVAVDSNVMKKLWNSKITNKKGLEIESLIDNHNLSLLNRPATKLDFVPAGTSVLDITLAGDKILAPRWFFPTIPSMSDHLYIYFEISRILPHSSDRPFTTKSSPRVPHITCIDMEHFRETLVSSVQSLNLPPFPVKTDVELPTKNLTNCIVRAARRSTHRDYAVSPCNMPWWSKEQCALRNRTRCAFKLWSREETHNNKQLCKTNLTGKELFSALKTLSGKTASVKLPTTLLINGVWISEPLPILESCAAHFFPKEKTSLPMHTTLVSDVETHIATVIPSHYPPVTERELKAAVESLNPKLHPVKME